MSSTIEITKTCEWCHSVFTARKCTTRYCCKRCAEHAYKDAKRKEHVAKEQNKANTPVPNDESPFITPAQCAKLLGVCRASIYNYLAANSIPCFQFKGKTLWSKKHIDHFFASQEPKEDISEWHTAAEIQERYGMTLSAIHNLVSNERIPKKKIGCEARYSKKHFDIAKGMAVPDEPEYYTMAEAMKHFNMTHDQIYHYIKTHGITKVKIGRIIKYGNSR